MHTIYIHECVNPCIQYLYMNALIHPGKHSANIQNKENKETNSTMVSDL